MVLHRLGERTEDDAELSQLLLERRRDRGAVEDRVDGDARQQLLLVERDPELFERATDFRIDFVEALQSGALLWSRVIDDALVVNRAKSDVAPGRLLHRQPRAIRLQPPFEQPGWFLLLGGNQPHDLLGEPARDRILLDVGNEA